ncbi:hypothetical protein ACTXT7_004155 [Hymenolepis weldensis]
MPRQVLTNVDKKNKTQELFKIGIIVFRSMIQMTPQDIAQFLLHICGFIAKTVTSELSILKKLAYGQENKIDMRKFESISINLETYHLKYLDEWETRSSDDNFPYSTFVSLLLQAWVNYRELIKGPLTAALRELRHYLLQYCPSPCVAKPCRHIPGVEIPNACKTVGPFEDDSLSLEPKYLDLTLVLEVLDPAVTSSFP